MPKQSGRYRTQWAAQFYAAAELTRRGYLVSLTLGNAPVVDLLVVSPQGKHLKVDVKGQSTKNFWIIRKREPQHDLFYILVYLPKDLGEPPWFFVLTSDELMKRRDEYKEHTLRRGRKCREDFAGMNWSTPLRYRDKWDSLTQ